MIINRKTYWSKLIVSYLVVIIVPLLIIGTIVYFNTINVIEKQTTEYKSSLMKLMNEKIEAYAAQIELLSMSVYQVDLQSLMDYRPDNDPVELIRHENAFFDAFERWAGFMGIKGKIEDIIWIKKDGKIYSRSKTIDDSYLFHQTWWYKQAMEQNGAPVIIAPNHRPYAKNSQGDTYFSLARKINNTKPGEDDLGILLIDINIEYIHNLLDLLKEEGNNVYILNKQGEPIYSQGPSSLFELIPPEMLTSMLESSTKSYLYEISNKKYLFTHYFSAKTGWTFLSIDPMNQLISTFNYIRDTTIIVGCIAFVTALIISLIQSWRIVRPIRTLQKSMRRVQKGEFDFSLKVNSDDEIGELTESFNEMVSQTKLLIEKVYQAEIREKEAYLQALQSQTNPHFLYNTLDAINVLSKIHKTPDIGKITLLMADMFRYNTNTSFKEVTLEEEIKQMARYVELVSIRYSNKINLIIDLPSILLKERVLKFSLQPIVENAVKHGLEMKPGPGFIKIEGNVIENVLIINILDDGTGMSRETFELICHQLQQDIFLNENKHSKANVGIMNVHKRLQLHYGKSFGVKISSELGKGTVVTMSFQRQSLDAFEGA